MQRRYDRQIIIQRKSVSQSGSGEEAATWADLAYKCLAHAAPTKGNERETPAQEIGEQEVTFTTRFHNIAAASRPLSAEDRVIFPADGIAANAQTPPAGRIYDILSADEVGRGVDWLIKAVRRADLANA